MPRMLTTAEWICRARKVHGSRYDYSKVEYQGAEVEVIITCLEHGNFNQKPSLHVYRGYGCPKCWQRNSPIMQPSTKEHWAGRASVIHGHKYDYSKAQYVNKETLLEIICLIHGSFWQSPGNHLMGKGCPQCARQSQADKRRMSTGEFVKRAKRKHGDLYEYSRSQVTNMLTKVCITCRIHGDFWALPANHFRRGDGCPTCAGSMGEKTIASILDKWEVIYEREKRFDSCRDKYPLPFDFWLPDHNACIEFHGAQHYRVVAGGYFGGEDDFRERQRRDKIKEIWCQLHDIQLIVIPHTCADLAGFLRQYLPLSQ